MKTSLPEQIYLQAHDTEGNLLNATKDEVTWCVDRINENDAAYILATPELAELLERLADMAVRIASEIYSVDARLAIEQSRHADSANALAARIREALGQDMLSQAQETPGGITEES